MIFFILVLLFGLFIGALLNIQVDALFTYFVNRFEIPIDMGNNGVINQFLMGIKNWYLLFFVLIPLMIYIFVNSQRPKAVITYG